MTTSSCILTRFPPTKAFSIVEVMFAIMILGIGFIMVAAIFPVGIQQGRDAVDETTGQAISREVANRAAAVMRTIGDDPNTTQRNANLTDIATPCSANRLYQWVNPQNTTQQITLGITPITYGGNTGQFGGGVIYLQEQLGAEWQYMGQTNYLTQILYKTGFNVTTYVGTLDVVALALRDGRESADQNVPLGRETARPCVRRCEVAYDGKKNIYSDMYIKLSSITDLDGNVVAMTQQDVLDFLGGRGTVIVSVVGASAAESRLDIKKMSDNPPNLQFSAFSGTWYQAWLIRNDVPVIGSFKLTTSLP